MRRVASAVALCIVVASALSAQTTPTLGPRRQQLRDVMGERLALRVAPSYAWQPIAGRSGVDARLLWLGDSSATVASQLGLDMGSARTSGELYSRTALSMRLVAQKLPYQPWIGASVGAGSGAGPVRVAQLQAGAGGSTVQLEVRTTWLSGAALVGNDSITPFSRPASTRDFENNYTDAEVRSTHALGRFDVELVSGARFGAATGQRQWAFGSLSLPVLGRLGLALSGGWRPEEPERAQRGGRFAQLAVLFRAPQRKQRAEQPAERAVLTVNTLGADRYALTLTLASAQSVRLKSDLTNWEPIELKRGSGGVWRIELSAVRGVYKVNVSIDGGAWIVPAGLIAVPDGYGGEAGVLILNGNGG